MLACLFSLTSVCPAYEKIFPSSFILFRNRTDIFFVKRNFRGTLK
jgi:hypothetical protein